MRYLLLGGCGFVGSHVVDRLVAAGHEVRVVSRRPEALRGPVPGVDYRLVDYRDRALLASALAGCDAVLHLISATTPGSGDVDPLADVNDNLVATIVLLDLMAEAGVQRLIYLSSGGTVYGMPEVLPIPETHPLRPINSYGIVKVAIESYIELYGRNRGLSSVILRSSNSYGERQGRDGAQGMVNALLRNAALGRPVQIWGDGTIVRDYLNVHDLADLVVLAAGSDETGVFNAGTGVGVSIRGLVDRVSVLAGRDLDVVYGPARSVDVPANYLDITRAKKTFGWEPKVALDDGLARTWAWHRSIQVVA